jgi:hypothetical protein
MAFGDQLLSQLRAIVDFTVANQLQAVIFV